jgi:ABC-type lipoprotein release transport system permease subunit
MVITLRNLLRRPRRTVLTIAGIAVGAAAYLMLVTVGRGLVSLFQESTTILGAEIVVQQHGTVSPWTSVVRGEVSDSLASLPGVRGVSRVVVGNTRFLDSGYFLILGVADGDPLLPRLELVEGRRPVGGADPTQMLIGTRAARRFTLAAGHLIETRRHSFEVAGVFETGHPVIDGCAVIDLSVAQQLFNAGDGANLVFVDLADPSSASSVCDEINRRHPGVNAHLSSDWIGSYNQVAEAQAYSRFLGLIALAIAMLGVSNVLQITISERTQEFAVLRAMGWSRWRVASLVLAEGAALSILGALCAIPLADVILFVVGQIDLGGYMGTGVVPRTVPFGAVLEGFVVCTIAGVLGSMAPLVRIFRLQPAQALRAL